MSYLVMCRVSGGVTGTREAPLKEKGQVRYFDTLEDAQARAAELDRGAMERAQSGYSLADFRYWAERA